MLHTTPTGIDRVEMAYARGLLAAVPDRLRFAARHPSGRYGRLRRADVLAFLDETELHWSEVGHRSGLALRRDAVRSLARLMPTSARREDGAAVYVLASTHHLARPARLRRILERERARFVCLVHDLIPITHPEYARAGGLATHRRRIETVVSLADGILTNSHSTLEALKPWIARSGRAPLQRVAHLGTWSPSPPEVPLVAGRPYFLCVATIEPRKNHLLLLHVWRRMAEERGGAATPLLILVGRRGWENEQVVDLLERSPALRGCLEEHAGLPDREVARLLAGTRAVLLPSFAEGFGMPVAEALAAGAPVICSDLAALREVGGDAPDYLDPLDGPAWMREVLDYATPGSTRRAAQLARLDGWSPPSWKDHFNTLTAMIDGLAS